MRSRGFRKVLICSTIFGPLRPKRNSAPHLRSIADFVQAHAYHGQAVPGPEGLQEIQSAAAAAASLPEAERVLIEGILANRVD